MRIAVAGATGVIGRKLVEALERRGIESVPLSRSTGVDVERGTGVDDALAGVDAVIDVLSTPSQSVARATRFFRTTTERLLAAERRAGVGHHIALSIVGVDDHPMGYYAGKRAQEAAITAGGTPWTILRATQFHEFAEQMAERLRVGPVSLVPEMRTRPVAASVVADALVDLATSEPVGRARDLAGPREEWLPDLARKAFAARGIRRPLVPLRIPGRAGRAMREGANLPRGDFRSEGPSFDAWLADAAR